MRLHFAVSLNSYYLNCSPKDSQLPEVSGRSCPELMLRCWAVLGVKTFGASDGKGGTGQCPPTSLWALRTDCMGWENEVLAFAVEPV